MSATRITKLLKRGKKTEAFAELVALIRQDYQNPNLMDVLVQVASSMANSIPDSRTQLLCGFVDELVRQKRFQEAVPVASYIYRYKNNEPEPNRLMAILCEKLQDLDKAEMYCERLCTIQPQNANNFAYMGRLRRAKRKMKEALEAFNHAIVLDEKNEGLLTELGIFLFEVSAYDKAAEVYAKLYEHHPNNEMAAANLLISYMALGELDKAAEVAKKADTHMMNNGFYLDAKAKVLLDMGEVEDALKHSERAIKLMPQKDTFKATLSHILLMLGRLREGFEYYKHRFSKEMIGGVLMDDVNLPTLEDKKDVAGKHIYVASEQGFGDTLNFCRLINLLLLDGAKVTFSVQKQVKTILEGFLPDVTLIEKTDPVPEDADFYCPLLNIAAIYRIGVEHLPIMENYISADAAFVEKWDRILGAKKTLRVGLTWSGGTATRHDRKRTISLEKFLTALPEGPDYISLQKDVRDYDQATLAAHPEIRHFGDQLDDFRDTAALVELVDFVVCVDTSIVHLTGAMGKEAWLLVPFKPDFRWLMERTDSPWYPSLQLLRQPRPDHWEQTLSDVRQKIQDRYEEPQLTKAS